MITKYPKMTKQHFKFIAEIISEMPDDYKLYVIGHFIVSLSNTNTFFDRTTFTRAALGTLHNANIDKVPSVTSK